MRPRRASACVCLSITCFIAGCAEPNVDVRAKTEKLKLALEKADTREDFVRIAEANGLDCRNSTAGETRCIWIEPYKASLASATPCAVTPGMISASAKFVDGRRQGDYDVRDSYSGC